MKLIDSLLKCFVILLLTVSMQKKKDTLFKKIPFSTAITGCWSRYKKFHQDSY